MITSLVTGLSGQDGRYLARALAARGDRVVGTVSNPARYEGSDGHAEAARDGVEVVALDLRDTNAVRPVVEAVRPDRVYHLAAMSSVAEAWRDPLTCARVNAMGTIALVAAMRDLVPEARLVNASSSEIYAQAEDGRLGETSPFGPRNPYGAAKLHAHLTVAQAREAQGMHGSNAVLFGHESPIRPPRFVSRKITSTLARIAAGSDETLHLGNIDVERDWGHAEDYVEAMMLIGEAEAAGDYIVATGELLSVRDFVTEAAAALGLSLTWQGSGLEERAMHEGRTVVAIDPQFFRPVDTVAASGDIARMGELGWTPGRRGRDIAREMALADQELNAHTVA